jgi:predicted aspartyl protease
MNFKSNNTASSIFFVLIFSLVMLPSAEAQRRGQGVKPSRVRRAETQGFRFTSGDSALNIPFEFYDGGILLKARINRSRPVTLSIDTGTSGVFAVVKTQTAKRLGLAPRGGYKVGSVGGELSVQTAYGVTVNLPGVEFPNRRIEIVSLGDDDEPGEPHIDGTFGGDFLKQFVTEIDFTNHVISLYTPALYHYAGNGIVVPLTIDQDGKPFVSLTMTTPEGASVAGRFILDTGLSGTLAFFAPTVRKYRLIRSSKTVEAPASDEAGGEYRRRIGRARTLQLGGVTIENPAVSYSTTGGADENADGSLGMEILRRFRMIIDYTRSRIILEPNATFNDAYDEDMSGLALSPALVGGRKVFKVGQVLANTPASEADLRAGDLIVAIDDQPASSFNVDQISRLLKKDGQEIKLSVARGSENLKTAIKLRRLI